MKHSLLGAAFITSLAGAAIVIPSMTEDAGARAPQKAVAKKPAPNKKPVPKMAPVRIPTVSEAPNGAVVAGNPAAKHTLVEYISYTCGHCAHFAADSEAPIKPYIASGKVKVEYRSLLRDPFDFAAALLAHCGTPQQFAANHSLLLKNQQLWMAKARVATAEQKSNWTTEDYSSNLKHIGNDIGLVSLMQTRGFTPAQSNACLADTGKQAQLLAMTEHAAELGVQGTPTFFLDGKMLQNNEWATVKTDLDAATK